MSQATPDVHGVNNEGGKKHGEPEESHLDGKLENLILSNKKMNCTSKSLVAVIPKTVSSSLGFAIEMQVEGHSSNACVGS